MLNKQTSDEVIENAGLLDLSELADVLLECFLVQFCTGIRFSLLMHSGFVEPRFLKEGDLNWYCIDSIRYLSLPCHKSARFRVGFIFFIYVLIPSTTVSGFSTEVIRDLE